MNLYLRGVSPKLLFPVLAALWAPLLSLSEPTLTRQVTPFATTAALAATSPQSDAERALNEGLALLNQDRPGVATAALAKFQQALTSYRSAKDQLGEGRAVNAIGEVHYLLGDYEKAETAYRDALTAYQKITPATSLVLWQWGNTLNNLGALYETQGQLKDAWDAYSNALTVRRQAQDRLGEGTTLNNLAGVYFRLGDNQNAQKHYLEALAIRRQVNDRSGEATTLNNLGFFSRNAGQYHQDQRKTEDIQKWFTAALNYYNQAFEIRREQNNLSGQASILNNMGAVYLDLSQVVSPEERKTQLANAEQVYQSALKIYTAQNDRRGQTTILNNLGGLHLSQERFDEAKKYYEAARTNIKGDGSSEEATTLTNLGFLYRSYGDQWKNQSLSDVTSAQKAEAVKNAQVYYQEALKSYQSALDVVRKLTDRPLEGTTLNNLAGIYLELNQNAQALATYEQALAVYQPLDDRASEATTRHNIGVAYARQGQYLDALKSYGEALRITQTIGDRPTQASILRNIGSAYAKQGNYQKAIASYQEAKSIRQSVSDSSGAAAIEQDIRVLEGRKRNIQ